MADYKFEINELIPAQGDKYDRWEPIIELRLQDVELKLSDVVNLLGLLNKMLEDNRSKPIPPEKLWDTR